MNYSDWEKSVPVEIRNDTLWRVSAYRLALFLSELAWFDVTKLGKDVRTRELSSQLYDAVGSIGANVAEGYSRGTGRDRARFYEYSLGSARESRHWYFQGRHILGEEVVQHRLKLLTEMVKLLLTTVPEQRGGGLREESPEYRVSDESYALPVEFMADVPISE